MKRKDWTVEGPDEDVNELIREFLDEMPMCKRHPKNQTPCLECLYEVALDSTKRSMQL